MNRGIRLGRIDGVEIVADLSVFVIAAAMVWVLYLDIGIVYPQTDPALATVIAIVAGALFILSVLIHEGSHAVMAKRRGLHVRRIQLLAFGGYTKIEGKEEGPSDEFVISIAGPVASLAMAIIFWLIATISVGIPEVQSSIYFIAFANLFIALFNLLGQSFALRGAKFLWIADLAEPDRLFTLGFSIPLLGSYLNILPILMAASQVFVSNLSSNPQADAAERMRQKWFMLVMAIVFLVLFYSFPAGLVLYWMTSNLGQLLQQRLVGRAGGPKEAKEKFEPTTL